MSDEILTGECSVVASGRFAFHIADKGTRRVVWRTTRRDSDMPHITAWYAVTEEGYKPSEDVEPGGWNPAIPYAVMPAKGTRP